MRIAWIEHPTPSRMPWVGAAASPTLLAATGLDVDVFRDPTAPDRHGDRARPGRTMGPELVSALARSHGREPYDLMYLESQLELSRLRPHLHTLPPAVLNPQTHAAGELRRMLRHQRAMGDGASRPALAGVAARLARATVREMHDTHRAMAVIAPSRALADQLRRDYRIDADRLYVVPPPVDLALLPPCWTAPPGGRVKIVCVAGTGGRTEADLLAALPRRLADLGGDIAWGTVGAADAMAGAHILLHPGPFEPFGSVVAQALSCGAAIVACGDVGACEEVDPACCSMVPAGDLPALEAAVREAVARSQGRQGPAGAVLARREAERLFSSETFARNLVNTLESVREGTHPVGPTGRFLVGSRIAEAAWQRMPRASARGHTREARRMRARESAAMDDAQLLEALRTRGPLPRALDPGTTERMIEWPWLLGQDPRGRLLDAGSTLNHAHVLHHVRPLLSGLDIVTLAPEAMNFPELGVGYLYGDLRRLPLQDASYDTVACLSVLEHVGLDNSMYGAGGATREAPQEAAKAALRELRRITRPGGLILLSVPYGVRHNGGWVRQFDEPELHDLITAALPATVQIDVYRLQPWGWARADLHAARTARYAGWQATAVACVRLDLPR